MRCYLKSKERKGEKGRKQESTLTTKLQMSFLAWQCSCIHACAHTVTCSLPTARVNMELAIRQTDEKEEVKGKMRNEQEAQKRLRNSRWGVAEAHVTASLSPRVGRGTEGRGKAAPQGSHLLCLLHTLMQQQHFLSIQTMRDQVQRDPSSPSTIPQGPHS